LHAGRVKLTEEEERAARRWSLKLVGEKGGGAATPTHLCLRPDLELLAFAEASYFAALLGL
jgi:hypothetical protein